MERRPKKRRTGTRSKVQASDDTGNGISSSIVPTTVNGVSATKDDVDKFCLWPLLEESVPPEIGRLQRGKFVELILRPLSWSIINDIRCIHEDGAGTVKRLLGGASGAGKSVTLYQCVCVARELGMIVMYIPKAKSLFTHRITTSVLILRMHLKVYGERLGEMECICHSHAGQSLKSVLEEELINGSDPWGTLLYYVTYLMEQNDFPVFMAIDQWNEFYMRNAMHYDDPLVRLLGNFNNLQVTCGAVVLAKDSSSLFNIHFDDGKLSFQRNVQPFSETEFDLVLDRYYRVDRMNLDEELLKKESGLNPRMLGVFLDATEYGNDPWKCMRDFAKKFYEARSYSLLRSMIGWYRNEINIVDSTPLSDVLKSLHSSEEYVTKYADLFHKAGFNVASDIANVASYLENNEQRASIEGKELFGIPSGVLLNVINRCVSRQYKDQASDIPDPKVLKQETMLSCIDFAALLCRSDTLNEVPDPWIECGLFIEEDGGGYIPACPAVRDAVIKAFGFDTSEYLNILVRDGSPAMRGHALEAAMSLCLSSTQYPYFDISVPLEGDTLRLIQRERNPTVRPTWEDIQNNNLDEIVRGETWILPSGFPVVDFVMHTVQGFLIYIQVSTSKYMKHAKQYDDLFLKSPMVSTTMSIRDYFYGKWRKGCKPRRGMRNKLGENEFYLYITDSEEETRAISENDDTGYIVGKEDMRRFGNIFSVFEQ